MRANRVSRSRNWLVWISAAVGTVFSGLGYALAGVASDRTPDAGPAATSIDERIERVRTQIAERGEGAIELPKYRLAQWFNFNNFGRMPGPGPFPNMGPGPGPFPNMGPGPGPFPNMAPFQNMGPPPMWRNF